MNHDILLVTAGFFHPPLRGRIILHRVLRQIPGYSFHHITSLEKLPADLERYAALVLHYHHKTISAAALDRLDRYVSRGGGVLAIHAATASFKETQPYFAILGGRFTGHGPVAPFELHALDSGLFAGAVPFTVRDELYLHEFAAGIETQFTTLYEGQEVPVVWTHRYGQGRVFYACPGHRTETMQHPAYQQVLQRGLSWVCGEKR